jgi:hypothetical protein
MNRYFKKTRMLPVLVFLCVAPWHSSAQRTLNPSEDWSWHFVGSDSNWTSIQTSPTPPPGGANGHFTATLANNTPPGTVLRCELFEGLYFGGPTDGQPLSTFLYTAAPPNTITGRVNGAWQDREGTIRFTSLSGAATINLINLEVDTPSFFFNRWDYWYLFVVPPVATPRLSISYSSNSMQLAWWTNVSAGYVLETTNALGGTSWLAVGTAPTLSNGQKRVTLSTSGSAKGFFRLRK